MTKWKSPKNFLRVPKLHFLDPFFRYREYRRYRRYRGYRGYRGIVVVDERQVHFDRDLKLPSQIYSQFIDALYPS